MNAKQLESEIQNNVQVEEPHWAPRTLSATADECCRLIESGQPVAIHFWAPWGKLDKKVDQTLAAIAPRLEGWASLYSCSVDERDNREWCDELDIRALPCVIVFAGGTLRHRIIGVRDEMTMTRDILIGLTTDELQEAPWWKFW